MASPQTITTTASVVATFKRNRDVITFQNTGANIIYIKKQVPGAALSIPSVTNYDFELPVFGTTYNVYTVNSTAPFMAVAAAGTSTLAVMETAKTFVV